ncbi:MAG TPA: ATP-binding cassette domain-containing protein [Candidatus Sumerlaeota bacterium]|nr:ATP-binding cassette domain-containing protein [Candidatus Sumerlaeota bacterium]
MAETDPLLTAVNLRKLYLERVVLDDVNFTIHEGERIALLGANGAGKSTLLSILTGRLQPDGGEVRMRRGLHVAVLDQGGGLHDDMTVGETVDSAFAEVRELEQALDEIHHLLERGEGDTTALLEKQSLLQHRLDERDPHTIATRTERVMSALGVPPRHRKIGELSGGERRRTALARTLLEDADLLLLDEPTNHLDAETLDWLEDFLDHLRGTVVFVTHDRYFLDNVATKMVELWRGRVKVYAGNYTDYLEAKAIEAAHAERAESTRQNLMRREIDWLRRQPKARTTKSKARIDSANKLINDKPPEPDALVKLMIPPGPRLGNTVIEAEHVSFARNGRELIRDFTINIGAGERVGIVGRNGLGKTTLLRLLLKELKPDAGRVEHGTSVRVVYTDQERTALDPDRTVLQEASDGLEHIVIGDQRIGFRAWLRAFLFTEETAAMPVRLLSGGERNRVLLAKMLRHGGNVVVMDEPTNDLDLQTLRVLEEALAAFTGCALVVSHDRYFLNRIATRIIAFRGDGSIAIVEGNYDSYAAWARTKDSQVAAAESSEARTTTPEKNRQVKTEPTAPPVAGQKKKLSFNEQREFATIEQRIAEAEERAADLQRRVEDPATYTKATSDEIKSLHAEAEAARAEADRLVERWMELSERA